MFRRSNMVVAEVHGLKELEKNLMAVGKIPATQAGQDAMLKAAEIMETAMEGAAPSSSGAGSAKSWMKGSGRRVKTGTVTMTPRGPRRFGTTFTGGTRQKEFYGKLRDAIITRVVPADKPGQVKVATGTGRGFWGLFSERGTKARYTGKYGGMKAYRGRMKAEPWMAPTFQSTAPRMLRMLGAQIAASIKRVVVLGQMQKRMGRR